jgi:hypothetical protein
MLGLKIYKIVQKWDKVLALAALNAFSTLILRSEFNAVCNEVNETKSWNTLTNSLNFEDETL